jgi:hypothetical protein
MSDKLNETFQKHLKLLHEHLNINEAYGDPAHLDWAMRDRGERPDWDPDGLTGIRQPSSYRPARNYDPEEEKRDQFNKTVAGVARNMGVNGYDLVRYLNQIKQDGKKDWETTDELNPDKDRQLYGHDNFDKAAFKRWLERDKEESERSYKTRQEKDKLEAPSREINSAAEAIRPDMTQLIHSIGLIKWQVFKLKSYEGKLKYLSDHFEKNEDKLKNDTFKYTSGYEDLKPYFDKYSKNDQKAKLILLAAIKKSEKSWAARGFFEQ